MLTPDQILNNIKLDYEIQKAEREHQVYVDSCMEINKAFIKNNPDNPYAHIYGLPIKAKKCVIGIRYVE